MSQVWLLLGKLLRPAVEKGAPKDVGVLVENLVEDGLTLGQVCSDDGQGEGIGSALHGVVVVAKVAKLLGGYLLLREVEVVLSVLNLIFHIRVSFAGTLHSRGGRDLVKEIVEVELA